MRVPMPVLPSLLLIATGCAPHSIAPLASAARRGDLDAIHMLIRNGADPNEPSGVNHWTPVMHAIHKNQREAAFALIEAGAEVNRSCCGGMTPLMMAAGYGQSEIVRGLLARGADPRRKDSRGLTALDVAVTGVPDIDAFTVGKCQNAAVQALLGPAPDLARDTSFLVRAAKWFKNCPEINSMLERSRAAH